MLDSVDENPKKDCNLFCDKMKNLAKSEKEKAIPASLEESPAKPRT